MATPALTQPRPKANRRYVERAVAQLADGDVFTLHLDGDGNWYTATGVAHSEMVMVEALSGGPAQLPAAEDQLCLVEVDCAKVRVSATLEIDIAGWAAEYGIDRSEALADARKYFANFAEAAMPEHLRSIVRVLS